MRRAPGFALWVGMVASSGWGLVGCATAPAVQAEGLALRKVVIYRNGVGYFERAGHVEASEVRFRVRKSEIGDFLATLAVLERGGSSVRSASFPLSVGDGGRPAPTPPPPLGAGAASPPSAPRSDLETVVMGMDGGEHDLQVGYIAPTPVWRPSYRLVLGKDGATLQAWGIVENLSGEDWRGVTLSLIAEAPLAFQAELAAPVIPPRPTVTDTGDVIAVVPQSETSLDQGAAAAMSMAAPAEAEAMDASPALPSAAAPALAGKAARAFGGVARRSAPAPLVAPAPARPALSGRARNLSALAAVALQAGATRYDLPAPVTIPDKSATMVMLLDRPIPGQAISLFAPDPGVPDSAAHPFRVARFTNQTGGLLERGPLAIFEAGAFLGQGMTDPLPEGATATVPFALERTLAVEVEREVTEEGARVYKIEAGALTVARDTVTLTRYRLRNGADHSARLLLKHARERGARLSHPPPGTEDNVGTGSALVPAELEARATRTVIVDERRESVRGLDWLDPLADDAVRAYLTSADKNPEGPAAANVKALTAAWAIRKTLTAAVNERARLAVEEADLRRATNETRNNLKALEKNKAADDLRAKLTERLEHDSARLDEVTKREVEVDLAVNEQRVRFSDAVRGVKVAPQTRAE